MAEVADDIKELGDKIVGLTLKQAVDLAAYLKDTHGIEPDIQVERPPEYYCLPGHNDVVLQQALQHLKTKANK